LRLLLRLLWLLSLRRLSGSLGGIIAGADRWSEVAVLRVTRRSKVAVFGVLPSADGRSEVLVPDTGTRWNRCVGVRTTAARIDVSPPGTDADIHAGRDSATCPQDTRTGG